MRLLCVLWIFKIDCTSNRSARGSSAFWRKCMSRNVKNEIALAVPWKMRTIATQRSLSGARRALWYLFLPAFYFFFLFNFRSCLQNGIELYSYCGRLPRVFVLSYLVTRASAENIKRMCFELLILGGLRLQLHLTCNRVIILKWSQHPEAIVIIAIVSRKRSSFRRMDC